MVKTFYKVLNIEPIGNRGGFWSDIAACGST